MDEEQSRNFMLYGIPCTDEEMARVMPLYKASIVLKVILVLALLYLVLK